MTEPNEEETPGENEVDPRLYLATKLLDYQNSQLNAMLKPLKDLVEHIEATNKKIEETISSVQQVVAEEADQETNKESEENE